MSEVENIFKEYHSGGDINTKAKDIRQKIEQLKEVEYICSILLIADKIKNIFYNLISEDPDKEYQFSLFAEKDESDNDTYYIWASVEIDGDHSDRNSEILMNVVSENLSSEDINNHGLGSLNFSLEVNTANLNNIEEEILSAFTYNEVQTKLFKATRLEQQLKNNPQITRKKNSI